MVPGPSISLRFDKILSYKSRLLQEAGKRALWVREEAIRIGRKKTKLETM